MTALDELIQFIEFEELEEVEREELISKLNIYGYSEERIKDVATDMWLNYCRDNISQILAGDSVIESHLLSVDEVKNCLRIAFEEYRSRLKDLNVDIDKFIAPF